VFCERLPRVARSYARQTDRASEILRLIGYVAGGRPGQRLLIRLAVETSDDTVLRRVRQVPTDRDNESTIRHLGVDDWAWRKGQDYGTILVDLDLHRVVHLLADRSSESLGSWLEQRPGIAAIARDRCGLYAEGAPDAQQVADRFHLILNLSSAVEKVFEERRRELVLPPDECPAALTAEAPTTATSGPQPSTPVPVTQQQQRRQRRLELCN
jgi:transposase